MVAQNNNVWRTEYVAYLLCCCALLVLQLIEKCSSDLLISSGLLVRSLKLHFAWPFAVPFIPIYAKGEIRKFRRLAKQMLSRMSGWMSSSSIYRIRRTDAGRFPVPDARRMTFSIYDFNSTIASQRSICKYLSAKNCGTQFQNHPSLYHMTMRE